MDSGQLQALIRLLDDNDEEVLKVVNQKLLDLGNEAIPFLEDAWENSLNENYQTKIENIIQNIQFSSLRIQLENWSNSEEQDLLLGAYLVSKHQYPDLEFNKLEKKIEAIKRDVWLELNDNLTALEKVKILNHIIYDIHGFTRNSSNFYSPQNSYINNLLDDKKGNAVSLSILYAHIAQKLDLPIYGVNLPKNFVLAYRDEIASFSSYKDSSPNNVLFYINPFNKGAVFGRREIDFFIKQQNLDYNEDYFMPCSNKEVIIELVNTLIQSYEKSGYEDKIKELNKILQIITT